MGGEPTFVSIDDMESDEWRTAAVGPHKRRLAGDLLMRLKHRWAPGGLLHLGQGKWYPGEQLPRWALRCYWRLDGQPMWRDESLFADPLKPGSHTADDARSFGRELAARLGVNPDFVIARLRRRALLHLERAPAADQRRRPRFEARRQARTRRGSRACSNRASPRRSAACCRCGSCGGSPIRAGKAARGSCGRTKCSSSPATRRWASACRCSRCCGTAASRPS